MDRGTDFLTISSATARPLQEGHIQTGPNFETLLTSVVLQFGQISSIQDQADSSKIVIVFHVLLPARISRLFHPYSKKKLKDKQD